MIPGGGKALLEVLWTGLAGAREGLACPGRVGVLVSVLTWARVLDSDG